MSTFLVIHQTEFNLPNCCWHITHSHTIHWQSIFIFSFYWTWMLVVKEPVNIVQFKDLGSHYCLYCWKVCCHTITCSVHLIRKFLSIKCVLCSSFKYPPVVPHCFLTVRSNGLCSGNRRSTNWTVFLGFKMLPHGFDWTPLTLCVAPPTKQPEDLIWTLAWVQLIIVMSQRWGKNEMIQNSIYIKQPWGEM